MLMQELVYGIVTVVIHDKLNADWCGRSQTFRPVTFVPLLVIVTPDGWSSAGVSCGSLHWVTPFVDVSRHTAVNGPRYLQHALRYASLFRDNICSSVH